MSTLVLPRLKLGIKNLKTIASKKLQQFHIHKMDPEIVKLYLQIIAWDTFLNAPSEKLLQDWVKFISFKMDEKILCDIFPGLSLSSFQITRIEF